MRVLMAKKPRAEVMETPITSTSAKAQRVGVFISTHRARKGLVGHGAKDGADLRLPDPLLR